MFYPDIKAHISPSALAAWHNQRSLFVKSYFLGEKTAETKAMKGGKAIHALIEGNFLKVKHSYENHEDILEEYIETPEGKFKVLGVPDSYELHKNEAGNTAFFVDYKSGKENTWDGVKLAGDLKMKTTAWLVYHKTGKPKFVKGFIEYIPTVWNPVLKEIEPTEGESVVAAECIYNSEELEAFTSVVLSTIKDINAAFEEWKESTDEFVSQDDIAEYADLERQVVELLQQQEVIMERITDQMTMGKKDTIATPFGTFYFSARKKYAYPPTLKINYLDYGLVLEDADGIAAATSAAKKKFETENTPESVTKTLSFRAKK